MKRKLVAVVIISILLSLCPLVGAADYYVDPNGSDDANGLSWDTAFATIQKGLDTASNGDTIDVNVGTYYEAIDFNGVNCTLTSTDPNDPRVVEATIIDANELNGAVVTITSSEDANCIITGFTITGGSLYGIHCNDTNPTISKCFINNSTYGICCSNGSGTSPTISGCEISDCNDGLYVGYSPTITGNFIYDNDYRGIWLWSSGAADITNNWIYGNKSGINANYSGSAVIRNNTIVGNSMSGIRSSGSEPTISNCIIWDCNDDLYDCNVTYSCIEDGDSGTGNISSDPCFVDIDANDFHLLAESPAIDIGDSNNIDGNELDIDGNCRIINEHVDMGAHENDGLISWWKLDEGSGNVVTDYSYNSHDGSLFGDTSWAPGVSGEALIFDGNDDYVQIGSTNDQSLIPEGSEFTISSWVNLTSLDNYKTIYGYCSSYSANYWAYCMDTYNGDFGLWIGNGTTAQYLRNLDGGNDLSLNQWYHLAAVFDGNNVYGYINGEYKNTVAVTLTGTFPKAGTGNKYELIGGAYAGKHNEFEGKIDDLRVWQRALTSSEVEDVFYDGMINIKNPPYNAVGDGLTDDSNSIQQAIDDANSEGKFILLEDATFLVNSSIDLDANTILYGRDAILKNENMDSQDVWDDPLLDVGSNCSVRGLVIDGNGKGLTGIKIWNEDNVKVENCTVQNFLSSTIRIFAVAIVANNEDCNNIQITSCTVKDVNSINGPSARAIMVKSYEGDRIYNTDINDCTFENIWSGNGPAYDGDAIHVLTNNAYYDTNDPNDYYWEPSYVTIQNCEFKNYSKRGVKVQCSNATVKNCSFEDPNTDYVLGCAIGITGGSSVTLEDNMIDFPTGPNTVGIFVSWGSNNTIQDNTIIVKPTGHDGIAGIYLDDANDTTVTNNQIRGQYGIRLVNGGDEYTVWDGSVNNTFTYNVVDPNVSAVYEYPVDPNNNNTTTPNTLPWDSDPNYAVGNKVLHDSNDIYECNTAHTNQEPPNTSYWDFVKTITW